ncbi:MAG: FAD-binding oxidoreductase [Brevinema sp.]
MLVTAPIVHKHQIHAKLFVLSVAWKGELLPGQFFMLHSPSHSHVLPRPISTFDYDAINGVLSFLITVRGEGTQLITALNEGDTLTFFGPLGNSFPTDFRSKRILLLGGMEGIAPMVEACKALKYNNEVTVCGGFKTQADQKVMNYFNAYEDDINIYSSIEEDGNLITSVIPTLPQQDIVFLCGSENMMKACIQAVASWEAQIFLSLDSHMACGVGACMGCTIKNTSGAPMRPCTDGPIFKAEEVFSC